jgi:transposase
VRWLLNHKPRGFAIVCLDESIFIQDVEVRRVWAVEGTRPIRIAAGSYLGAMSLDGRQLFRQYRRFNGRSFLDYLKKIHRKFRKLYLFMDRATQHTKTRKVLNYLKENRKTVRVRWFPVGSPELNVMEECWRQGEKDLSASHYHYKNSRRLWQDLQNKEIQPRHAKIPPNQQVFMNVTKAYLLSCRLVAGSSCSCGTSRGRVGRFLWADTGRRCAALGSCP